MEKKKAGSNASFFSIGIVFLILGMNDYRMDGNAHGTIFVTIGLLFCLMSFMKYRSDSGKKKKGIPPSQGGESRESKAEVLPEQPAVQEMASPETAENVELNEIERKREDLKSLYEAGIISKEEYQERIQKFHRG